MIINTRVIVRVNSGIHAYYFNKSNLSNNFSYFNSLRTVRNEAYLYYDVKYLNIEDVEKIKKIKSNNIITPIKYRSTTDKNKHIFEIDGKKYLLISKDDTTGNITIDDQNVTLISMNNDVVNSKVITAFNELIDISKSCNIELHSLKRLLSEKAVICEDAISFHSTDLLINPSIEIQAYINNTKFITKHLRQRLLPKFIYQLDVTLEIFPYSFLLWDSNVSASIFQKYLLLSFNMYLNSFGIGLSIDLQFIFKSIYDFLFNHSVINQKEKDTSIVNLTDILKKKAKVFLDAISLTQLERFIKFFLFVFRIIRFNIKYKNFYLKFFYDVALKNVGYGISHKTCHLTSF